MGTNGNGNGGDRYFIHRDDRGRLHEIKSAAAEAIIVVIGSQAEAARRLELTTAAISHLVKQGVIRNVDTLFALEDITVAAGKPISARELAGKAPWRGPERHPGKPNGFFRRDRGGKIRGEIVVPHTRGRAAASARMRLVGTAVAVG